VRIESELADGGTVSVEADPRTGREQRSGSPPTALYLPASLRGDGLVEAGAAVPGTLERALASSPSPALAVVAAIESMVEEQTNGVVLMIEEPELFLRPHAQRTLYRLLRDFAAHHNQVLYSTHAATFLNVGRLEEIAFVERDAGGDTRVRRPRPLPEAETFRTLNEFDAERSELLLARAALLVEGRTEKLVFPFVFRALGFDADREAISIVECGGKPNIPIIAQVCNLAGIPYLVVHDRDALPGRSPIPGERVTNELIARVAGPERTIELTRDFEEVAHLHGHKHKPERAVEWFAAAGADEVPGPLAEAARRAIGLARTERRPPSARSRGGNLRFPP
jgi:hypothetical protein